MISTIEITETICRLAANHYLADTLGSEYHAKHGELSNGQWRFTVICQRNDMNRNPAVGGISVEAVSGRVKCLTDEQIRNMVEAGEVQAAQARNELARDQSGYILRRHAQIKANVWISDLIGMKIGVGAGTFIAQPTPIWRFPIISHLRNVCINQLGIIDVDAQNGQVIPLTATQVQTIQEDVSAAIRRRSLATA